MKQSAHPYLPFEEAANERPHKKLLVLSCIDLRLSDNLLEFLEEELVQYVVVVIGAQNRGRRLVMNVLDIESCQ